MLPVEELFQTLGQGSTWGHVTLMITSLFAFSFLHHVFVSRFVFKSTVARIVLFLSEAFLVCLCPALVHTYWSYHIPYAIVGAVVAGLLLLLVFNPKFDPASIKTPSQDIKNVVLVTTCMVITAVDCRLLFDVRFTKTVQHGYSAMDVGTGLFVALRALHDARPFKPAQFSKRLIGSTPNFLIFGGLGIGRSVFIALSDYYQDMLEYGKHWNFFLTLLCIEGVIYFDKRYFTAWTRRFTKFDVPNISFFLGTAYVLFLVVDPSFEEYLLGREPQRAGGILDQNREGIASIFGYLFIYGVLLEHAKRIVPAELWKYEHVAVSSKVAWKNFAKNSLNGSVYLILLYICTHCYGLQPSRRAANITYGFWMMSIAFQGSALSLLYHQLTSRPDVPSAGPRPLLVQTAIAHNGAAVFLVANLLTGLANYLREPLDIYTEHKEFASLVVYSILLCLFAYLLEYGKSTHKKADHKKHDKPVSSNFEEVLGYDQRGIFYEDEDEEASSASPSSGSKAKTPVKSRKKTSIPASESAKRKTVSDLKLAEEAKDWKTPATSTRSHDKEHDGDTTPTGRPIEAIAASFSYEKPTSSKSPKSKSPAKSARVTRSTSKSPSKRSKIPSPTVRRSRRLTKSKLE